MVRAVAIVHADSTDYPIGMLIFTQKNLDSPVKIKGILVGVQPDSVHVRMKENIYFTFVVYHRDFMYTKLHYLTISSIVQRPELI